MTSSLRAEWLKLTTTPVYFWMTTAAALLSAFIVFGLVAKGPPPWDIGAQQFAQLPAVLGITNGLFCLLLGLRAFTEEFRFGTIAHTAFSDPHWTRTVVAKALVVGFAGVLLTTAAIVLTFATMFAMSMASGGTFTAGASAINVGLGLIGGGALWAVLGVGLGAIIRQPVASVVAAIVWVLGFENIAGTFLGSVARYLPGQAAQVMAGGEGTEVVLAAAAMAAWAAAVAATGWFFLRRRDVF